jgi:hypothetical protein
LENGRDKNEGIKLRRMLGRVVVKMAGRWNWLRIVSDARY